ncbi:MAG TPA: purine-nucleoside phosphorylase [Firmicutes bacterium]|jgi:purine-nucleoside phosphorylase|nr:purine-nucleoside phosphorylase [Bacillota bacterium]HAW70427.1 purine-nucleoside phosphorylase [Bacillota bacterium]HAZ21511.1 purine-nucleoside phosphorylase [Bacillota bacterium]HBE05643.1 purine-nucleoside phosphorylase [Bacillota bacterium]HBG45185.1 purine-nucleoside phosphorylase [Bacillota bacterium]
MSIHIAAKPGEIAETILLPGDPLRAKMIAETFLENPFCYNEVRGMYGFTGTYKGKRVSVQGTGMGMPSISIYANELISSYGVKNLIRVGTCGAMQPDLGLRDVILAMSASTGSNMNRLRFKGMDYAPTANFELLRRAYEAAVRKGIPVKVGSILSHDVFYDEDPDAWKMWAAFGTLAVEMEAAELYTLAAKFGVRALAVLTVSDSMVTKQLTSAEERQKSFTNMVEIALEAAE